MEKKPFWKRKSGTQIKPESKQIPEGVPKPVTEKAILTTDRNRWFYVSVGLLVLCLLLGLQTMQANKRFAENVQVAWVKLSPSGTWDIEFHDDTRGVDFFQNTIDSLLMSFAERRYSKVRYSIESDYGFSLQFMSPQLAREFTDSEQFNAAGKIVDFIENSEGQETFIKVNKVDHFDSDITRFGEHEGTLYRSNIFVTVTKKNRDGSLAGEPIEKIGTVHWRIKSKEEIQADKKNLSINPIGLEILKTPEILVERG